MSRRNRFLQALATHDDPLLGLWLASADPYVASICAGAGFDWLVVDGEHGPNDLRSILAQLLALEASPAAVVVRPPAGEPWMLKQLPDIGADTLLVPMVDTPEQARDLVRAVRYPPAGIRGCGAGLARAADFGRDATYTDRAARDTCLVVQAESRLALANLERIVAVDGVDAVFVGPVDLAADMGEAVGSPAVQEAVAHAIATVRAAGKPVGILAFDEALARRYLDLGARFVAVGSDVTALVGALDSLAVAFGRGHARVDRAGY